MSVHPFLAVGHVRASNMVNPSLASVFLERFSDSWQALAPGWWRGINFFF